MRIRDLFQHVHQAQKNSELDDLEVKNQTGRETMAYMDRANSSWHSFLLIFLVVLIVVGIGVTLWFAHADHLSVTAQLKAWVDQLFSLQPHRVKQ